MTTEVHIVFWANTVSMYAITNVTGEVLPYYT